MDKNKINEEVTITPIIRDIERLFNKILNLLIGLFIQLGKLIKNFILFTIRNFKILFILTILGGVIGYLSIYVFPRNYTSTLVLEPNVNAKYQLFNDIDFFDALIERGEQGRLAKIFNISEEEAESLSEISIVPFNTTVERLKIIDQLYRGLDSTTKRELSFDDIYFSDVNDLTNKYAVKIVGTDEIVFSKLEPRLIEFIERVPEFEKERKEKKENLIRQKFLIEKQLTDLDTLKYVTNQSTLLQAKKQNTSNSSVPIYGQSKQESDFNPLEIYDKYIDLAGRLNSIESRLTSLNNTYTIHSHFTEFGSKYGLGKGKRAILFGFIFFSLGAIIIGLRSLPNKFKLD
ncbi:MAG: hypothetical protein RJQ00_10225 [Vicingaceae bacterium]